MVEKPGFSEKPGFCAGILPDFFFSDRGSLD
jgi:hypothetical protein